MGMGFLNRTSLVQRQMQRQISGELKDNFMSTRSAPIAFNEARTKAIKKDGLLDEEIFNKLSYALENDYMYSIKWIYQRFMEKNHSKSNLKKDVPLLQQNCEKPYLNILFLYHFKHAQRSLNKFNIPLARIFSDGFQSIKYFIDADLGACKSYLEAVLKNREYFTKRDDSVFFEISADNGESKRTSLLKEESNKIVEFLDKNKELIIELLEEENGTMGEETQGKKTFIFSILKEIYISLFDKYRQNVSAVHLNFVLSHVFQEAFFVFCKNTFNENSDSKRAKLSMFFNVEVCEKYADYENYQEDYFVLMKDFLISPMESEPSFDDLFGKLKNLSMGGGRRQYITFEQFEELFKKFILAFPKESEKILPYLEGSRPDLIPNFLKALHESRDFAMTLNSRDEKLIKEISNLAEETNKKIIPNEIKLPQTFQCKEHKEIALENMGKDNDKITLGLRALAEQKESKKETNPDDDMAMLKMLKDMEKMNLQNLEIKPKIGRGLFVDGKRLCQLQIENNIQEKIDEAKKKISKGILSFFRDFAKEMSFLNQLSFALKDDPLPKLCEFRQYEELYDTVKAFRDKRESRYKEFTGLSSSVQNRS